MKCPNCGYENANGAPECAKCGIIFGKLAQRRPKPAPAAAPQASPARSGRLKPVWDRLAEADKRAWEWFVRALKGLPARAAAAARAAGEAWDGLPLPPPVKKYVPWLFAGMLLGLLFYKFVMLPAEGELPVILESLESYEYAERGAPASRK